MMMMNTASSAAAATLPPKETVKVGVTEVTSASEFFVQITTEPRAQWIAAQMVALGREPAPAVPADLKAGQLCAAKQDGAWYRAYVERILPNRQYELYFLDFGNTDVAGSKDVRVLPPALAAVAPQAIPVALAGLKMPKAGSEFEEDVKAALTDILKGGVFVGTVYGKSQPDAKARHPKQRVPRLALALKEEGEEEGGGGKKKKEEEEDGGPSMDPAVDLVAAGWARVVAENKIRDPQLAALLRPYRELEKEARAQRKGVWVYGDPGDSEDEAEEARGGRGGWGGAGARGGSARR